MFEDAMNIAVILPAAGQSRRFAAAGGKSKLEMEIAGRTVLQRAVELFTKQPAVKQIIVAADPDGLDTFKFKWADKLGMLGVKIVAGGKKERWETVLNALKAVEDSITHVAVHDAARPVADPAMIERCFDAAKKFAAVIPAVPCSSTLKKIEDQIVADDAADPLDAILGGAGKKPLEARKVVTTVPRAGLWLVQTPQVFRKDLLIKAYGQIAAGKLDAAQITDDAGLVEALGETVVAVPGDELNVKITVPGDLKFAEAVLMMRAGKPAAEALGPKRKHPTWAQTEED